MRTTILLFVGLLLFGCESEKIDYPGEITDGFCIVSGDDVLLTHHDIDYYDYSAHLIYLKSNKSFDEIAKNVKEFKVFAGKKQAYTGHLLPAYSSTLPVGPTIITYFGLYNDFIVPISLIQRIDHAGNLIPDTRMNESVVAALKKYGQFRTGLNCEIASINYHNAQNVTVKLKLTNNDPFNYYYLDPDKMGLALFHYFTNGLTILDTTRYVTHKMQVINPEPWNSWKKEWLSVLKSKESREVILNYNNFEELPAGHYRATFRYPGLHYQIGKNDINQSNGKIWLGEIYMIKEIVIP